MEIKENKINTELIESFLREKNLTKGDLTRLCNIYTIS